MGRLPVRDAAGNEVVIRGYRARVPQSAPNVRVAPVALEHLRLESRGIRYEGDLAASDGCRSIHISRPDGVGIGNEAGGRVAPLAGPSVAWARCGSAACRRTCSVAGPVVVRPGTAEKALLQRRSQRDA